MIRRILFVDDEPRILEGIENLMFDHADDWELEFAESGVEALERLERGHFDVLVSDMRMPGMGGAELLERVEHAYPETIRVVLSGHAELDTALRALPIAHQFLSKPCAANTLTTVLERACELRKLVVDPSLRALLGEVRQLPPQPRLYRRVCEIMNQDDWSLEQVADVVTRDIAIATKLVQVANTAFFSRGKVVADVAEAIARLGGSLVRDLTFSMEVERDLTTNRSASVRAVQRDGFATAIATKAILGSEEGGLALLAGLVHDTGRLVLGSRLPGLMREVRSAARQQQVPEHVVERERLGTTHAELGAYVLGIWGMPPEVIQAVALHHEPSRSDADTSDLVGALHVASSLVAELREGAPLAVDVAYLERTGDAERIPEWRAAVARTLEDNNA